MSAQRLELLVDKNAKLSAQCDVQRREINKLEKRQALAAARAGSGCLRWLAGWLAGGCLQEHKCFSCGCTDLSALCRLEQSAEREEAYQETLLCVNRLWEELNGAIGFVQYRWAPRGAAMLEGRCWKGHPHAMSFLLSPHHT